MSRSAVAAPSATGTGSVVANTAGAAVPRKARRLMRSIIGAGSAGAGGRQSEVSAEPARQHADALIALETRPPVAVGHVESALEAAWREVLVDRQRIVG